MFRANQCKIGRDTSYQVLLEFICYIYVPIGCEVSNGLQQMCESAFFWL